MSAVAPAGAGCVVKMRMDLYSPEVDLSKIGLRDVRSIVEGIMAASNLLNLPISLSLGGGIDDRVIRCLDNLQAHIQSFALDIADAVEAMSVTDPRDVAERNWILTVMRAQCAEGLIYLTGPGAPDCYIDAPAAPAPGAA